MKDDVSDILCWFGIIVAALLAGLLGSLFAFAVRDALADRSDLAVYEDSTEVDLQSDAFTLDMEDHKSLVALFGNILMLNTKALSEKDIGIVVEYPYIGDDSGNLALEEDMWEERGDRLDPRALPSKNKESTVICAELQEDGTFIVIRKETMPNALHLGPIPTRVYKETYIAKEGKIVSDKIEEGEWVHRTITPEHYEFDETTSKIASSDNRDNGNTPYKSE